MNQKVKLIHSSGSLIEVNFYDDLSPNHFVTADASWLPIRIAGLKRLIDEGVPVSELPSNLHWSWSKKASKLNLLAYRGFGLELEGRWHGLMLTISTPHQSRSESAPGKPLIYVDYIESAPWNVKPFVLEPEFHGVGSILLVAAVQQSISEGFKGRVGLHSLPESEGFYRRIGMQELLSLEPPYYYFPWSHPTITFPGATLLLLSLEPPYYYFPWSHPTITFPGATLLLKVDRKTEGER